MLPPKFFSKHFKQPKGPIGFFTGRFMTKHNSFVYPAIESVVRLKDGQSVLEIGFGTGIGVEYFLSKYQMIIDGIDFSKSMCKAAEKRNRKKVEKGQFNIQFGDFLQLEIKKKYDRIVFANVHYFWDDPEIAFSKIRELLKPKGRLAFYLSSSDFLKENKVTNTEYFNHHKTEDLIKLLGKIGFVNAECKNLMDDSDNFQVISCDRE